MCDFQCPREATLKKHTNTKHQALKHEKAAERKLFMIAKFLSILRKIERNINNIMVKQCM